MLMLSMEEDGREREEQQAAWDVQRACLTMRGGRREEDGGKFVVDYVARLKIQSMVKTKTLAPPPDHGPTLRSRHYLGG